MKICCAVQISVVSLHHQITTKKKTMKNLDFLTPEFIEKNRHIMSGNINQLHLTEIAEITTTGIKFQRYVNQKYITIATLHFAETVLHQNKFGVSDYISISVNGYTGSGPV